MESTFYWKGCRFAETKQDGVVVGLEATCRDPKHQTQRPLHCKRSLRFTRHGGREVTEQKLKWWLLQHHRYESRSSHVNSCPYKPNAGELPSLAELNLGQLSYNPD